MEEIALSIAPRWMTAAFTALAAGLLICALWWRIPMMLWDHLDLLPIYEAWLGGSIAQSDAFAIHHGSHMHTAAYAALVVTTALSGGQTWLDCLINWCLLLIYAAFVVAIVRRTFNEQQTPRWQQLVLVLLALYPGHLANLQWGWQIAVFLCLIGSAIAIVCLGRTTLSWSGNIGALAAAILAWLSFATAMALVPTALILIALREDLSAPRRLLLGAPWLAFGILIWMQYAALPSASALASSATPMATFHYALNFIGAGAVRFATDLAPWLALLAIATAGYAFFTIRSEKRALPWLGFMLFGIFAALSTAIGRTGPYGVEHGFVQRYVSFSSLFWLGWFGILMLAQSCTTRPRRKIYSWLMAFVAILVVANSLHLMKKAQVTGQRTRQTAAEIAATYPNVDDELLRDIYFNQPSIARERLHMLKRHSFAPFQRERQGSGEREGAMNPGE